MLCFNKQNSVKKKVMQTFKKVNVTNSILRKVKDFIYLIKLAN